MPYRSPRDRGKKPAFRLPFQDWLPPQVRNLRILGIPLERWLHAAPDLALAITALIAWLLPGAHGYKLIFVVLIGEFCALASSPISGFIIFRLYTPWLVWPALLGIAGYCTWYLRDLWQAGLTGPIISFWLLTLNRMRFVLQPWADDQEERFAHEYMLSCFLFIGGAALFFWLKIPPLALVSVPNSQATGPGGISWQNMLALALCYYSVQGLRSLLRSRSVNKQPAAEAPADPEVPDAV
ncbi:MAG: hypothetical protein ACYC6A_23515 [Armatimonadota bacterium]